MTLFFNIFRKFTNILTLQLFFIFKYLDFCCVGFIQQRNQYIRIQNHSIHTIHILVQPIQLLILCVFELTQDKNLIQNASNFRNM
ncbi:unnamed protein product [Paramecium sonneborni]|uniref:Transmembrane protein n=1 Tax=Paramecium sonneborni TaxID=65129 RepID=A0A8S1QCJ1_9CILI|nr:unnamed protein product [Paramecium sonneborni]